MSAARRLEPASGVSTHGDACPLPPRRPRRLGGSRRRGSPRGCTSGERRPDPGRRRARRAPARSRSGANAAHARSTTSSGASRARSARDPGRVDPLALSACRQRHVGRSCRAPSSDGSRDCPGVRRVYEPATYHVLAGPDAATIRARDVPGTTLASAGDGIKIGIIDDGIDQRHPFFDPTGLHDACWLPEGPDRVHDREGDRRPRVRAARARRGGTRGSRSTREQSGHAMHVAGIAAGNANTLAEGTRVSGIAPRAYIGNYKALTVPDRRRRGARRQRTRDRRRDRGRGQPTAWTSSTSRSASPRSSRRATWSRSRSMPPPRPASSRSSRRATTTTTSARGRSRRREAPPSAITVGASTSGASPVDHRLLRRRPDADLAPAQA